MKKIFKYNDEYGNECTFLAEKYYKQVCALITDFFEEPLPNNDFHKHFIKLLNEMEDYDDVYIITTEYTWYWAICIIENDWTINSVIKGKNDEELLEWVNKYDLENDIVTFIIEGINQETYVFTNEKGDKSIFLRKKYYEFVCDTIKDFFEKPLVYNLLNATLINNLNALYASGNFKDISKFIDQEPYYWAMSIIENEWTKNTLNSQQLEDYKKFLEAFYKNNNISSFVILADT